MSKFMINTVDIPAEGREFTFTDPTLWSGQWEACGMKVAVVEPLEGRLRVLPQGPKSCVIQGSVTGRVSIPCDRCMERAVVDVEQDFDIYEEIGDTDETDEPRMREEGGIVVLDAGAILWEQFVLALPVKPLCSPECKGLCPQCGINLNTGECSCESESGDPRMAALRGLKVPDRNKQ
ncbi:YceD family protein [Desulfobaculum sp.]|jgi:uncharacterized protein